MCTRCELPARELARPGVKRVEHVGCELPARTSRLTRLVTSDYISSTLSDIALEFGALMSEWTLETYSLGARLVASLAVI